jgi:antitoxin component of MazEF toxin-antitoxin module
MELQINQWGNSLAVRIPASVAKQMHLSKGSKISLVVDNTGLKAAFEALPDSKPSKSFADVFADLERLNGKFVDRGYTETAVEQMRREARY